jgi:ParB family chromosome partitioning protein
VKTGLGRGLDALINQHNLKDTYEPAKFAEIKKDDGRQIDILAKIPVEFISANPFQPRMTFEPEAFEELKKSILSNGLIQPVTVRRLDNDNYVRILDIRKFRHI